MGSPAITVMDWLIHHSNGHRTEFDGARSLIRYLESSGYRVVKVTREEWDDYQNREAR